MISLLSPWLNWLSRRRAKQALLRAERKRAAVTAAIEARRVGHREFRPLFGVLRDATNASLRASVDGGV